MFHSDRLRGRTGSLAASMVMLGILAVGLACSGCGASASSADSGSSAFKPTRPATFIVATGVGGGGDLFARAAAAGISQDAGVKIGVENHTGGNEVVGDEYALSKKNDPYYLFAANSSLILIPYSIKPPPDYTWKSYTPIAELAEDQQMLVVPENSPYKNLKQLVAAAKTHKLRVAVTSETGTDNAVARLIEDKEHVSFQHVILDSGASGVTALLSGNADFSLLNPSEAIQELQAHKLRAVAVFSNKRYPASTGLGNVPTAEEQGVDVTFPQWRALLGPPGLSTSEVAYWANAARKWSQTASYKKYIKQNVLFPKFAVGPALVKVMQTQQTQMASVFGGGK